MIVIFALYLLSAAYIIYLVVILSICFIDDYPVLFDTCRLVLEFVVGLTVQQVVVIPLYSHNNVVS